MFTGREERQLHLVAGEGYGRDGGELRPLDAVDENLRVETGRAVAGNAEGGLVKPACGKGEGPRRLALAEEERDGTIVAETEVVARLNCKRAGSLAVLHEADGVVGGAARAVECPAVAGLGRGGARAAADVDEVRDVCGELLEIGVGEGSSGRNGLWRWRRKPERAALHGKCFSRSGKRRHRHCAVSSLGYETRIRCRRGDKGCRAGGEALSRRGNHEGRTVRADGTFAELDGAGEVERRRAEAARAHFHYGAAARQVAGDVGVGVDGGGGARVHGDGADGCLARTEPLAPEVVFDPHAVELGNADGEGDHFGDSHSAGGEVAVGAEEIPFR